MNLSAKEKVRYALDRIRDRLPIAVPLVLAKWTVFEDTSGATKTARTNGVGMWYNPEFVDGLTLDEVSVLMLHEAAHPLYNHPLRFRLLMARMGIKEGSVKFRRLHALHNISADLAINSALLPIYKEWNGLSMIAKGCFPRHGPYAGLPEGKSLDYYFSELLKEENEEDGNDPRPGPEPQRGKGEGQGGGQPGEGEPAEGEEGNAPELGEGDDEGDDSGNGKGGGEPGDDDDEDDGEGEGDGEGEPGDEPGKGKGKGKGGGAPGDGDDTDTGAGGGEPGDASDSAAGDDEGEGEGEGGKGKGKTACERAMEDNVFGEYDAAPVEDVTKEKEELIEDLEEQEREWRRAVAQAVVMDKAIGNGAGDAITESLREGALVDKPDDYAWIVELERFLTRYAPGGYTFTRISRRHAYRRDIIFPEAKARNSGRGLMIVDTSGSMGDGECDRAIKVTERFLQRYPNSTVKLISCDTKVYEGETYTPADFPMTEHEGWKGRGGTDLSPAFKWAEAHKNDYDWCVCVTDMWWSYTAIVDFGMPTFWLHVVPAGDEPHLHFGDVPFGVYHVMPSVTAE